MKRVELTYLNASGEGGETTPLAIIWRVLTNGTPPALPASLSYRGTSIINKRLILGFSSRAMPGALWYSWRGGHFPMSEVCSSAVVSILQ